MYKYMQFYFEEREPYRGPGDCTATNAIEYIHAAVVSSIYLVTASSGPRPQLLKATYDHYFRAIYTGWFVISWRPEPYLTTSSQPYQT